MGFLGMKDDGVKRKWLDLVAVTDGTENCYDENLFTERGRSTIRESGTDAYVESWSGSVEPDSATAKRMCAGCHIIDQCREYAIAAKEPVGVWGGTVPADRGIRKRFKGERTEPDEDDLEAA